MDYSRNKGISIILHAVESHSDSIIEQWKKN